MRSSGRVRNGVPVRQQPAGGPLERLADRLAPGQPVAGVVDLVEDRPALRLAVARAACSAGLAGDLGVGGDVAVQVRRAPARPRCVSVGSSAMPDARRPRRPTGCAGGRSGRPR